AAARALVAKHAAAWFGAAAPYIARKEIAKLEWRCGFVRAVWLSASGYRDAGKQWVKLRDLAPVVTAVLRSPVARFVEELALGAAHTYPRTDKPQDDSDAIAAAVACADALPVLRK